jgi:hypothetical protein
MNPFIRMPDHWTPRKVELILDFIDDLYQAIWNQYGNELCVYWDAQPAGEHEENRVGEEVDRASSK